MDTVIIENSMKVPQKLKIELPYDPIIILLGIRFAEGGTHRPSW